MRNTALDIDDYLSRLQSALDRIDRGSVRRLADRIEDVWRDERSIYVFGNGGSGATASHFAEDLGKNALRDADLRDETKRRVRVMSLTDNTSWITAIGNDLSFDQVFVQQLMHYGRSGDLVIAISGSGNSPNVVAAVEWANRHGLRTFGMTGYDGGRLKRIEHEGLHVALACMGMVESVHLAVCHWVVDEIRARLNPAGEEHRCDG